MSGNSRGVNYNMMEITSNFSVQKQLFLVHHSQHTEVTNDYHGVTEKMSYRSQCDETVDMSFYVDKDYKIVEFFESWIDFISGMNKIIPMVVTPERCIEVGCQLQNELSTTYKGPIHTSLNLKRTYLINRCHMNLLMLFLLI